MISVRVVALGIACLAFAGEARALD